LKYFINEDELLVNVVDYFTERYNKTRSDEIEGEMKRFYVHDQLLKKNEKIENMKNIFSYADVDGKLVFKSFRETCSQELEKKEKSNKRKLNEFQFVIGRIQNEELAFEIMKKYLYNRADEKCFFYALDKHLFPPSNLQFTDTNYKVELILPACYFGHLNILEWLLNNNHDIISKSVNGETGLHLGNSFCNFNSDSIDKKYFIERNKIFQIIKIDFPRKK
jgi:hypothetical protein